MPRFLFAIAAFAALCGCSSDHKLALCKGPLIALNAAQWQPSEAEMAQLAAACPGDK